ncbi:LuxR family two component transcriptional regulator [Rhizobium sp. BK376]|nr:LuxR family two component transcriptional regulator [Rhizobium sp. BK376]
MYSITSVSLDRTRTQSTGAADRPLVVVIDDDLSIRESLELLISSAGWSPALFASAKEFLDHSPTRDPSCIVLDVNMPGLTGLDLQRMLTSGGRRIPIIFVTGFGDVPMTVRAMKAGAFEFLTKPIDTAALLDAIGGAVRNSETLHREDEELANLRTSYGTLSQREREVMSCVVKGLLNKQTAYNLGISEITVKAHRGQMMRKMEARSVPELVHMALRLQLIEDTGINGSSMRRDDVASPSPATGSGQFPDSGASHGLGSSSEMPNRAG